MTTSSLTQLARRADKLQAAIERRKAQATASPEPAVSTLPTIDRWSEFARLTWITTSGTVAPFDPYDFQIDLIKQIYSHQNVIVNKSRQVGVSETVVNALSCRAATEPGYVAVVFSKTQGDSSQLARRAKRMLNSIPGHSFRYATDSATLISIVGFGTIHFLPGSPRAARGIPSCSDLWIDEAAFVDGAEEIYRAASPTLSMLGEKGRVIVTSTPDTASDWYGSLWHAGIFPDWLSYVERARDTPAQGPAVIAELNRRLAQLPDKWLRVAIHYSQHPVYNQDPNWAKKTREDRRITQSAWATEYELSFGATDSQIYPYDLISRGARGSWRECGSVNRTYVLAIDPNAGGSDYFVGLVLDITSKPYEVVSLYRENGRSTEYSLRRIKELIEDYIPHRIIVEKQAMGAVIAEALQGIVPEYAIELFSTSQPSKITATDRILFLLEHDDLIFPEGVIVDELRAFQQKDHGVRAAASGFNDDTVMALAFACSLIPETPNTAAFFANI